MSDVFAGPRWLPDARCVRHQYTACVSCLAYDFGDLRAQLAAANYRATKAEAEVEILEGCLSTDADHDELRRAYEMGYSIGLKAVEERDALRARLVELESERGVRPADGEARTRTETGGSDENVASTDGERPSAADGGAMPGQPYPHDYLKPIKLDDDGVGLQCPVCSEGYLCQKDISVASRDKEDGEATVSTVRGAVVSMERKPDKELLGRRDSLQISFECEQGCKVPTLVLMQHKGLTLIGWK